MIDKKEWGLVIRKDRTEEWLELPSREEIKKAGIPVMASKDNDNYLIRPAMNAHIKVEFNPGLISIVLDHGKTMNPVAKLNAKNFMLGEKFKNELLNGCTYDPSTGKMTCKITTKNVEIAVGREEDGYIGVSKINDNWVYFS